MHPSVIPPHISLPVRRAADAYETLHIPALRRPSEPQVCLHLRFGKFLFLLVCGLFVNVLFAGRFPHSWLNFYLTIAWTLYLPITLMGLTGAIASRRQQVRPYRGQRQEQVIFLIPTIARRDTLAGLRRVVDSILLCAPQTLPNFQVHLVLEEGAEGAAAILQLYRLHARVQCLMVPQGYHLPNGTRYKARANQYALEIRKHLGLNRSDVFLYHGDDDTSVGHDTMWSIAQFIEHNSHDLAQGLLTYPHQLTPSWFCRLADSVRPTDDLSRFYFCTATLGTPLVGLHGEHLLLRASVEEQIGWDFGPTVKVEDAYFGLAFAARYPGRATFLPSCSYGASPACVRDLVTQRRRWACGLVGLLCDHQVSWNVPAMGTNQQMLYRSSLTGVDSNVVVPSVMGFGGGTNLVFHGQGAERLEASLVKPKVAQEIVGLLQHRQQS